MVFELTPTDFLLITIVVALVAVAQFFKGRKINLILMNYTASKFEEILKPKDKIYQWLGLYVGYKAVFKIGNKTLDRVEVTLTLIPRQSLLYYPIALLTSRFDRVFLVYCFKRKFYREAHLVRKGYYRLGIRRVITNIDIMKVSEIKVDGTTYYMVFNDASLARKLLDTVKSIAKPKVINHIAIVPANNTIYVAAKLDVKYFEELVDKTYRLAMEFA
ncbi:MAG: hypothetical protein B6U85_07660 [Desulfurococcales archaeon ex4484_42]|nr:MAG: hypothetical protein B6U85_07660 [Desulfurococcales archaeon ex4484_42]